MIEAEWYIIPDDKEIWTVYRSGVEMKSGIATANEAWEWVDNYINPPDFKAANLHGFKVKGIVR